MVLWIEGSRAVIAGDTLVDFGRGLEISGWLRAGATRGQVVEGLHPLLDLPVDVVLATHGGPTDRTALDRGALLTLSSAPRNPRCRCGSVAVVDELLPEQTWHRGAFMEQSGRNR
jgi:glyoxylase-like metal-dependent hydrolase (beta-lactamase superfamily II)